MASLLQELDRAIAHVRQEIEEIENGRVNVATALEALPRGEFVQVELHCPLAPPPPSVVQALAAPSLKIEQETLNIEQETRNIAQEAPETESRNIEKGPTEKELPDDRTDQDDSPKEALLAIWQGYHDQATALGIKLGTATARKCGKDALRLNAIKRRIKENRIGSAEQLWKEFVEHCTTTQAASKTPHLFDQLQQALSNPPIAMDPTPHARKMTKRVSPSPPRRVSKRIRQR